ncbi:MAG: (Na+)-NQR maturation NqrM [Pseudomonadales bacterium]|nr:(Na+)-NQR maturation NqrM [Pseudomonadales bacterium]MCP5184854.1 (Na+)-NQR maturation NqrM [Pseudomonadales bacterium]
MSTLILVFLIMLIVVGAMAVGVLFGRKPIAGSCGGMKSLGLDTVCEVCGGNPARCENAEASALTYDASELPRQRKF